MSRGSCIHCQPFRTVLLWVSFINRQPTFPTSHVQELLDSTVECASLPITNKSSISDLFFMFKRQCQCHLKEDLITFRKSSYSCILPYSSILHISMDETSSELVASWQSKTDLTATALGAMFELKIAKKYFILMLFLLFIIVHDHLLLVLWLFLALVSRPTQSHTRTPGRKEGSLK